MGEKVIKPLHEDKPKKDLSGKKGKKATAADLTDDLKRVQADFANYKRRTEEERVQLAHYSKQEVITELLPVIDNIDRALAHVPKELKSNEWAKGVSQVAKQLESQLEQMGVRKIATVGEEFDPHLHEAVSMDDKGKGKKQIISSELQAGYLLNEQIIRHAVVKVKKG